MSIERTGRQESPGRHELPQYVEKELQERREVIDAIDQQLIVLLAERFQATSKVGEIKRTYGLPVLDDGRETELYTDRCETAEAMGVDAAFCKEVFSKILQESRRRQQEQLDE